MAKLFANSGDLDRMSHSVASDLGLKCLPITLLRVSRVKWVNVSEYSHVLNLASNEIQSLDLAICKVNTARDGILK